MISRIRVEARAATMEEAKREIEVVLNHAQQAAYLEGLGGACNLTDNHYGEVRGRDQWSALGLDQEGRQVIAFEPTPNPGGGVRQYGYSVLVNEEDQPEALRSANDGSECTRDVLVLLRDRPITMESFWLHDEPEATAEEILANIRQLVNVRSLTVEMVPPASGDDTYRWLVQAEVASPGASGGWEYAKGAHESLREAALEAYGQCGQEVTVYETRGKPHLLEGTLGELVLTASPSKPTAEELAAFTELALRPEVQEIAYGIARSRVGVRDRRRLRGAVRREVGDAGRDGDDVATVAR